MDLEENWAYDIYAEGNMIRFAENVAVNRELPVRVFSTVAEAEKWPLGNDVLSKVSKS